MLCNTSERKVFGTRLISAPSARYTFDQPGGESSGATRGESHALHSPGNDSLYGEGGEDLMCGEGDVDLMMGGSESDNMYGGFGVDDSGSDCGPGLNDGAEESWTGWDYVTTTCAW